MDRRLREFERAALPGDVEAEAALLAARIRAEELSMEGLRLAAYCGHEGAALVLGTAAPQVADGVGARIDWIESQSAEAKARLALGSAGRVVHPVDIADLRPIVDRVTDLWLAFAESKSVAAKLQLTDAALQAEDAVFALTFEAPGTPVSFAAEAVWAALVVLSGTRPEAAAATNAVCCAARALAQTSGSVDERAWALVQEEIVPWALGISDPVWSRVQVRNGKVKIEPEDLAP